MRKLVWLLVVLGLFGACKQDKPRGTSDDGTDPGTGSVAGSCVETYSRETLPNRQYAFDGEVTEVTEINNPEPVPASPDETSTYEGEAKITFRVNRWYKGGSGASVTLKSSVSPGAVSSVDFPAMKKGSRYLVAGDEDFIGVCGFTRSYTESEAEVWASTFG